MKQIEQTAELSATNTSKSRQEIAELHLGDITWLDDHAGCCTCPGYTRHTKGKGKRDCMLYLDEVPTLYCVHTSCREVIANKNKELRHRIGLQSSELQPLKKKEFERLQKVRETRERHRTRASLSLPTILKNWQWTYQNIVDASPTTIPACPHAQARMLLARFPEESVVWTGDTYDSGAPQHSRHFRRPAEWMSETSIAGPLICPSTFKPDGYARTNQNVATRPFLVVESDSLDKNQVGGIFRWLQEEVEMDLVAIVDTAGKSLHAWFEYPEDSYLEELKLVLPALQCDPSMFTPSQPVRMPGCLRDGKYQKLIYLGKETA